MEVIIIYGIVIAIITYLVTSYHCNKLNDEYEAYLEMQISIATEFKDEIIEAIEKSGKPPEVN